ncbi:MAG: Bax inhibitor-1/YccA family protein [Akkermansia sp.]|nr:Bax inhibitor-1/YccA family protein [Akkermansia sp.]
MTPYEEAISPASAQAMAAMAKAYLNKVYTWMAVSLLITAGVAVYAANSLDTIRWVMEHPILLCVGSIGIVLIMSFCRNMLTSGALAVLFLVFSAAEGLLFGPLLLAYTSQSIGLAFGCAAGMFGAMALYGACTKRNLSTMGRTLFMLLIGLIIAGIANMFWGNSTFDLIASGIGVIVFALFTAYDTQRLLQEGLFCEDEDLRRKGAILGALTLYLDFINLFLYLLRFLGRSND